MKNHLSAVQSAKLIELGISSYKASETEPYSDPVSQWTGKGDPIFTLNDLLNIIPKRIDEYKLTINADITEWCVAYESDKFEFDINKTVIRKRIFIQYSDELIDAIFHVLCRYLKTKA